MNIQHRDIRFPSQCLGGTVANGTLLPPFAANNLPGPVPSFALTIVKITPPPRLTSVKHIFQQQLKLAVAHTSFADSVNLWTGLGDNCAHIPKNGRLDPAGAYLASPLDQSHNQQPEFRK